MAWVESPSRIRLAAPECETIGEGSLRLLVGTGDDEGLFALPLTVGDTQRRCIVPSLVSSVTAGDVALEAHADEAVNGYCYYSSGDWRLFHDGLEWVYARAVTLGTMPNEAEIDGEWTGDEWYSASAFPAVGESVTFEPRGSIKETGTPIVISRTHPRYESDTQFGVYSGADGLSGEKLLGTPRFVLTNGAETIVTFHRSALREGERFAYGSLIRYDETHGKWVIGSIGAAGGWREGEEPSVDGAVTFAFRVNEGDEATGDDYICSFLVYDEGEERVDTLVASVAIWQ